MTPRHYTDDVAGVQIIVYHTKSYNLQRISKCTFSFQTFSKYEIYFLNKAGADG